MDYEEILELAAKCRNPVVRNALLASAKTRRSVGLAERLIRAEIRTARRDAEAARAELNRMCDDICARGAEGDPKYTRPIISEYAAISEAELREAAARKAAAALRAFHDRLED